MDPEDAARDTMSGPRYGVANVAVAPEAYLGAIQDADDGTVYPSDIPGKERTAADRGLRALEQAGLVERNGSGYTVRDRPTDDDITAFVDEIRFQLEHASDF